MKTDLVTEKLCFLVDRHPYYESLNKKIIEESNKMIWTREIYNADGGPSNVKAPQTYPYTFTKSTGVINDWILNLISSNLKRGLTFKVMNSWLANYGSGDWTARHDHGSWYSYVYFVRTPRGSSPLIFTTSGKRIKAQEGKVVIFPGNIMHHVPPNRGVERMTLAGNIELVMNAT